GFDRIRQELDRFDPDFVIVWGDDQFENFREDVIPPYCVLAYDDRTIRPYDSKVFGHAANFWGEPADREITVRGRPDVGRRLVEELLALGFDASYAYRPAHDDVLPHAFLNTALFLDRDR